MPEEPRRDRRRRGRRRGPPRPQQAPTQPTRPPALRRDRVPTRGDRAPQGADRGLAPARRPTRRGGRARPPRQLDEIRPGAPAVILLDCREGEPDRSGSPATFEGFFDFETGESRRSGTGIPRLRVGDERLWGFECWWRLDPRREGLTDTDRTELEESKRILRGLMRDARRGQRLAR